MPRHLLVGCLLYIASRSAMMALAPLYETGTARITSPILMLLFITVPVSSSFDGVRREAGIAG